MGDAAGREKPIDVAEGVDCHVGRERPVVDLPNGADRLGYMGIINRALVVTGTPGEQ